MPRPEFPRGVILSAEAIHRINEERRAYDADPEDYERRERAHRERIEEEEQAERDFYAQQLEEQHAQQLEEQRQEEGAGE